MAPQCPSPWLPLLIPAPAPGPTVHLLLLLLLLVPAHPQSMSWMQGAPTTGGDSSGEDDPLEEDLPSEEDIPGEEDQPGMKTEPGEENSLNLEDLPTTEAPRDTQGPQKNVLSASPVLNPSLSLSFFPFILPSCVESFLSFLED